MDLAKLLVIPILALVSSCAPQVPACSGSDVEATVFNIARNEIAAARFLQSYGRPISEGWTVDRLIESNPGPEILAIAMAARDQAAAIELDLAGTRTNEENANTRAVACAATLTVNDREIEITYTAQYSEDGMVYVEVFGL